MASAMTRRSAMTVAVATFAAITSSFATQASAATFSGTVQSQPPADASNVVHANRPTLVGTFSDNLKAGSTITVYDKADSAKTDVCGSPVVSGKTVSCAVPADLSTTKTYDAVAHGVRASDGAVADAPVFEFKVDYPVFDAVNSIPKPTEAIVSGSEAISAAFNETISGDPATAFKVYELNADGTRGVGPLSGSTAFPTTGTPAGPGKTVTFSPAASLVDGAYEAVVTVNGVNSDNSKNPAAVGTADYRFFIHNAAPADLHSPAVANNQNDSAFPFTGTGAPGTTINVFVPSGNQVQDQAQPTGGSTVVPDCSAAPKCPWTVSVDLTNLSDNTYSWTATATDANNKSSQTGNGSPFTLDTNAPDKPSSGSAHMQPNSGDLTLLVSAGAPAPCTPGPLTSCGAPSIGFVITVTDPESHTVTQEFDKASLTDQPIDVSTLDNGSLDVAIKSVSQDGNVSGAFTQSPSPTNPSGAVTVTKNAAFAPNFGTSTLTAGGTDVPFQTATTKPVQPPTKITVEFNESITLTYMSPPSLSNPTGKTNNSSACITDVAGNCTSAIASLTATDDGHGLSFAPPTLPDGQYGLRITTYSAGCANSGGACDTYAQRVTVPGTTNAFLFTVDGTKPNVGITAVTNPITPDRLQTAGIIGTADSDVSVVQLTLKSSNDPNHTRVATANVTNRQWSLTPLPLSGVLDGILTITASGQDVAGNTGVATAKATLSGLSLNVLAGDSAVLLSWKTPSLANGATPAYSVLIDDLTTGTLAQPVTPPPASNATQFRIGNLVNGHLYAFELKASDSNGNGPVAVVRATPRGRTTITNFSTAHRITYGQSVLLHGRLTNSSGGVGGKPLSLYPVYAGGRRGGAAHLATNSSGYWSFATRPIANTTYVVSFAGDPTNGASSAVTGETVLAAVKITSLSARSSSHTSAVRIAGTVGPNEHGRTVYIYEVRNGHNVRIAAVRLSSSSAFVYTHTWSTGTHTVFARFYSQNGVTGNNSKTVKFSRS